MTRGGGGGGGGGRRRRDLENARLAWVLQNAAGGAEAVFSDVLTGE